MGKRLLRSTGNPRLLGERGPLSNPSLLCKPAVCPNSASQQGPVYSMLVQACLPGQRRTAPNAKKFASAKFTHSSPDTTAPSVQRSQIQAALASDASTAMNKIRAAIAASNPCAGPTETLSTVISTNSRTPAPPGRSDAKPITIAKQMAAVAVANSSIVGGVCAELGIAVINIVNDAPISNHPSIDHPQPASNSPIPILESISDTSTLETRAATIRRIGGNVGRLAKIATKTDVIAIQSGTGSHKTMAPATAAPFVAPRPPKSHRQKDSNLALISMILGIVSMPGTCFYCAGLPTAIAAVIVGNVALSQINRGEADGKGMAVTGIALGTVTIVLVIAVVVAVVVFGFNANWFNNF